MPLEEIQLNLSDAPIPAEIQAFLQEADKRCDEFFDTGANKTIPAFIPADYELIYRAILALQEDGCLLGNRFCEWGSGLGTATCLASLLGFQSSGIEIAPDLLQRARALARDYRLDTEFLEGSFLPEGFDFQQTQGGRELTMPSRSRRQGAIYEGVDWELEEIDLFYIYPWPAEQEATLALFDAIAADGAYLICYYGDGELCTYTKYLDEI